MPIKHFFTFVTSGFGKKEADEPTGWDSVGFTISRPDGRKGVDTFYSGNGEASYTLQRFPKHHLDIWIHEFKVYGHQAEIYYTIDLGNGSEIVLRADMERFSHNYESAEVVFVQVNSEFKENYEVTTDLFSDKDTKGNPIDRVQTDTILLKAKPVTATSSWKFSGEPISRSFQGYGQDAAFIAPFNELVLSDIKDTNVPFENFAVTNHPAPESEYQTIRDQQTYIRAKTNLNDTVITIKGLNLGVSTSGFNVRTQIKVNYGISYVTGEFESVTLLDTTANVNIVNQDYTVPLPLIQTTGKIWIQISVFQPFSTPGATPVSNSLIEFSADTMEITTKGVGRNTLVKVVRLIDAARYTVKSASGLDISAPRLDAQGEYYNRYLTTAPLMRGLTDKPFNMTCKQLIEGLIVPWSNGDYQLNGNIVEIKAAYRDHYRDYFIGSYREQSGEFKPVTNTEFACNLFKLSYSNYAAQKENEKGNSYDIVHGNVEIKLPNTHITNVREDTIEFIADPFLLADMQDKSQQVSENTTTQDDGKIVIIDVVPLPPGTQDKQTATLQHRANGNILRLTTDSTFSWAQLGVYVGSTFVIGTGDNLGLYSVQEVTPKVLTLLAIGVTPVNIEEENTTFVYYVDPSVTLTNRTNEEFGLIENISDGDNFANLVDTVGRITQERYKEELATNCLFRQGQPVNVTKYEFNPTATTQFRDLPTIVEGGNFTPTGAILTPFLIKTGIVMSLEEFIRMREVVVSEAGYIQVYDPVTNLPVKGYIKEGTWLPIKPGDYEVDEMIGTFDCVLKEKYEQFLLKIWASGGTIILNDEIQPAGIKFSTDEFGEITIFDVTGLMLFKVRYDRVQINNSGVFESSDALSSALMEYALSI